MKPADKDKLNECLKILDTTDLGLSMVWLWTWSTIKGVRDSTDWEMVATEDEMWDHLCEAVEAGMGFSLEYGAEQHYEDVLQWMLSREYMIDLLDDREEDEEEEEDEDE
jgi:hypothetical protein